MARPRPFLHILTLLALCVGGWGAWRASLTTVSVQEERIMLMPGPLPELNPFLPASEAERHLCDLIHEPLIRIDRDGRLAMALAEEWSWHQNMTCWFANAQEAKEAAQAISTQPVDKRAAWDLETITPAGSSLTLRFTHPGNRVDDEVLAVFAAKPPQRLTFLLIASTPSMRQAIQAYAEHPDHKSHIKRVWFDDNGSCEVVSSLTGLQAQQSLIDWLLTRHSPVPEVTPIREVSALLEPVLDFRIKPGLRWDDGTLITAADVRATVNYVLPRPWPLPGRDSFRHIQSITQTATGVVRVVYRKRHSPTLAAWTALPILPAAWLKLHVTGFGADYPPGAGDWRVTRKDSTRLWLGKRGPEAKQTLQVVSATSPLQTRIGLATGVFDIWWPLKDQQKTLTSDTTWRMLPTPPHNQLMLVWQTESPMVKDIHVRQALSLALNRQLLSLEMPGGQARLHDSFFPPGRWFSAEPPPLAYDPNAAEQSFAKAGWLRDVSGRLKKSGQPLKLLMIVPSGNVDRLRLANALAQSWEKAGVQLEVKSVRPEDYQRDLQEGLFDLALLGSELSPGWDVLPFWHSSQAGQGMNISRISDPKLDLLLDALVSEFDSFHLQRRAADVDARLAELRPAQPLFTDVAEIAIRSSRFPGLRDSEFPLGITLRQVLSAQTSAPASVKGIQMHSPK